MSRALLLPAASPMMCIVLPRCREADRVTLPRVPPTPQSLRAPTPTAAAPLPAPTRRVPTLPADLLQATHRALMVLQPRLPSAPRRIAAVVAFTAGAVLVEAAEASTEAEVAEATDNVKNRVPHLPPRCRCAAKVGINPAHPGGTCT
jgi:hypothetical protein